MLQLSAGCCLYYPAVCHPVVTSVCTGLREVCLLLAECLPLVWLGRSAAPSPLGVARHFQNEECPMIGALHHLVVYLLLLKR